MNLNLLAYGFYFTLTAIVIWRVGRVCYQNGNVFVSALIPDNPDLCLRINKLLLLGYYLLNLGYSAITILGWQIISSVNHLIEQVAYKTALIILMIAVLHYVNIFLLQFLFRNTIKNYIS